MCTWELRMHPGQPFLGLDVALTGSDADLLSYSRDRPGPKESFPQRAGREDFLSQEVEKTELLRATDRGHARLQLLFEEGELGRRFSKVQVTNIRPERLILDRPVLLASQRIRDPSTPDSDLRSSLGGSQGVGIQLLCCKRDA